ncbi:MAG TPA: outer membrane lipoprotein chaperone LolA [Burkholderiales bacterium]|nr:outer membrane lipoprotein chaperone LolA [Burkholderiales bacterium]
MHRIFLAIVLSLASLAALAQGSSLERFQTYLRTTQAARADFDQKVFDRTGKLVQESKGSFSFLRPGRFRWTYAKPNPQLIVGDGERVWVYDEDLKQVTVRKLASALGSTPAALLAGAADIEKAFELSDAGDKEGLAWVEARPREKEAGFERVRLGLGVAGVEAMELVDHFGQTSKLRFTSIQRNPRIDGSEFRFTPPKGADVLGDK